MADHGLSEKQVNLIGSIITEFAPAVESVSIFVYQSLVQGQRGLTEAVLI